MQLLLCSFKTSVISLTEKQIFSVCVMYFQSLRVMAFGQVSLTHQISTGQVRKMMCQSK